MTDGDGRATWPWITPWLVTAAALVLPVVALATLVQVRSRLESIAVAAQRVRNEVGAGRFTYSGAGELGVEAIRFVAFAAVVAVIGLVAVASARALSTAARVAITGCCAVLLVHAALLASEAWRHDVVQSYPGYSAFVVVEVVLLGMALVTELYCAIHRIMIDRGAHIDQGAC
ncbi:hypothetical protein ACXYTP_05865 [Tsukamurella ocularis]|uniref:hypothetical protein n=1 Tax=Tsukamurella ocularis TaxID=1970234 RepID=UPI0039EE2C55